tara:strand:- start:1034 stop:1495 length:462 start_codon:yes stop_codon:yes gene_type:complete
MGIPMYGQNGDGNILGALSSAIKMMKISIAVTSSGNADNTVVGLLPANALPVFSVVHNSGDTALASNACVLDVSGIDAAFHVTGELNALAADGKVAYMVDTDGGVAESNTTVEEIRIDGGSGMVTASGSTTIDVYLYYVDSDQVASDSLASAV